MYVLLVLLCFVSVSLSALQLLRGEQGPASITLLLPGRRARPRLRPCRRWPHGLVEKHPAALSWSEGEPKGGVPPGGCQVRKRLLQIPPHPTPLDQRFYDYGMQKMYTSFVVVVDVVQSIMNVELKTRPPVLSIHNKKIHHIYI